MELTREKIFSVHTPNIPGNIGSTFACQPGGITPGGFTGSIFQVTTANRKNNNAIIRRLRRKVIGLVSTCDILSPPTFPIERPPNNTAEHLINNGTLISTPHKTTDPHPPGTDQNTSPKRYTWIKKTQISPLSLSLSLSLPLPQAVTMADFSLPPLPLAVLIYTRVV